MLTQKTKSSPLSTIPGIISKLKIDLGLNVTEKPAPINALFSANPNATDSGSLSNITISIPPFGTPARLVTKASLVFLLIVLVWVFETSANTCFSNSNLPVSAFSRSALAVSAASTACATDSLAFSPIVKSFELSARISSTCFSSRIASGIACASAKNSMHTPTATAVINCNSLRLCSGACPLFAGFLNRYHSPAQPRATNPAARISQETQNQMGRSTKRPTTTIKIVVSIPQTIFGILIFFITSKAVPATVPVASRLPSFPVRRSGSVSPSRFAG